MSTRPTPFGLLSGINLGHFVQMNQHVLKF
ncbi:hypothetical protein ACVNPX_16295 [Staphylococcus aureus]